MAVGTGQPLRPGVRFNEREGHPQAVGDQTEVIDRDTSGRRAPAIFEGKWCLIGINQYVNGRIIVQPLLLFWRQLNGGGVFIEITFFSPGDPGLFNVPVLLQRNIPKAIADQMHQVFVFAQARRSHLLVEYQLITQDNHTIKLQAADFSLGNPGLGYERINFTVDQPLYHWQQGVVGNTDRAWQLFVNELVLTRSHQGANTLAKQICCRIDKTASTIIHACF